MSSKKEYIRKVVKKRKNKRLQVQKMIKKIKGLNRVQKVALSTVLFVAFGGTGLGAHKIISNSGKEVILVDLKDRLQNEAVLTDIDGNLVDIGTKRDDIIAITFADELGEDKVRVVLILDNGRMLSGFIDAKYLDNEEIDKIKIDSKFLSELSEIGVVAPQNGVYLRDEAEFDQNTDNAKLLIEGTNLVVGKPSKTVEDSTHEWRKAISVSKNEDGNPKLEEGFVASEYLINSKYEDIKGTVFKVDLKSAPNLKLRKRPGTNSDIIYKIPNGEEVILIPNIQSYSDGVYDWFYVAVKDKDTGDVITGYVAATYYDLENEVHYLTKVREQNKENSLSSEDKAMSDRIYMEVDTSKVGNVSLKLRTGPSTDAEIISELGNGTKVYIDKKDADKTIKDDNGREWIMVYTDNDQKGYVAKEYLKDLSKEAVVSDEERKLVEMKFGKSSPYEIEGYYGIDVNNKTTKEEFERLLNGKLDASGKYGYKDAFDLSSTKFRNYTEMDKPSFAMIKIGASSTVHGSVIEAQDTPEALERQKNMLDMVQLCEEHQIPQGFYFYSQCTNEEEMLKETEYLIEEYKKIGGGKYNVFPLCIDYETKYQDDKNDDGILETYDTRLYSNIKAQGPEGKLAQTKLLNKQMNLLREAGINVSTYLDHSGYSSIINYDEIEEKNKKDVWIVECGDTRSVYYESKISDPATFKDDAVIRQVSLDQGGYLGNVKVPGFDVNFMNKDYFKEKTKGLFAQKEDDDTSKSISLNSMYATLYDMDNDEFLYDKYDKTVNDKVNPASITKILTAYIVDKYGDFDDKITYSSTAISLKNVKESGYTTPKVRGVVEKGNSISVKDALHISLLCSDNPTTVALEEYIEEKTGQDFIKIMNKEAKKMGAKHSHFTNTYGYAEDNHYVTARDMAKIAAYIAENSPEVLKIMGTSHYTLDYKNINIDNEAKELQESSGYYNEDVIGAKTGFTKAAGQTMVTIYDLDGKHFVIVTLNGPNQPDKHTDARKLYNYAKEKLSKTKNKSR